MPADRVMIDESLVSRLLAAQFPQWADLPIRPVEIAGWDNRIFRLGEDMAVRLPSAADYAAQVEKEHRWLPTLAPFLPLPIPVPLAMGEPADGYPWRWSVYQWLEGASATIERIADLRQFAIALIQARCRLQGRYQPVLPPTLLREEATEVMTRLGRRAWCLLDELTGEASGVSE